MESSVTQLRPVPDPPHLPQIRAGNPALARAVTLSVLVVTAGGLVAAGIPSIWRPDGVVFCLILVALATYLGAYQQRTRMYFYLSEAPALAALALLGPLPAVLMYCIGDIIDYVFSSRRIDSLLFNITSCTFGVFVASITMELLGLTHITAEAGASQYLALLVVGVVLVLSNFAAWAGSIRLEDTISFTRLLPDHFRLWIPCIPPTLVVACATTALYFEFGSVALLLQIPALLGLQLVLVPRVMERMAPWKMHRPETIRMYALAIADVMELSRSQRRVVGDAALHCGAPAPPRDLQNFPQVMRTVLYSTERWDGHECFPGVVSGDLIPIESRVLAVASRWAQLTAGNQHPADAALADVTARAGSEFDPAVVAAAKLSHELGAVRAKPQSWLSVGTG